MDHTHSGHRYCTALGFLSEPIGRHLPPGTKWRQYGTMGNCVPMLWLDHYPVTQTRSLNTWRQRGFHCKGSQEKVQKSLLLQAEHSLCMGTHWANAGTNQHCFLAVQGSHPSLALGSHRRSNVSTEVKSCPPLLPRGILVSEDMVSEWHLVAIK